MPLARVERLRLTPHLELERPLDVPE